MFDQSININNAMECVIYTTQEGVADFRLPFMDKDNQKDRHITDFLSNLSITVCGPHPVGKSLAAELKEYFSGERKGFSEVPLILDEATEFQRRVWDSLKEIPYGERVSYEAFAMGIGSPHGARAVGQALKRNRWPVLIPCHRVVSKDGGLGGFSAGILWKEIFLAIERGYTGGHEWMSCPAKREKSNIHI
jgi:O-6-methylguanine DNA methyltransferase